MMLPLSAVFDIDLNTPSVLQPSSDTMIFTEYALLVYFLHSPQWQSPYEEISDGRKFQHSGSLSYSNEPLPCHLEIYLTISEKWKDNIEIVVFDSKYFKEAER
jgi:hypothetical protein